MRFINSIRNQFCQILFPHFIVADFTFCRWWMKITGLDRRSYAILAQLINCLGLMFYFWVGNGWNAIDTIFFSLCLVLDVLTLKGYLTWLKNPTMALKINGIHWRLSSVDSFGFCGIFMIGLVILGSLFSLAFVVGSIVWMMTELYTVAVFATDGPPKPDNTLPKTIKNKLKSLVPKPSFVPNPVGV